MSFRVVVAAFSCLVPFLVYLPTLCPTAYWIDSGELIASAYTLGIAHPSGYPLYVLTGRLFSLLPAGEVAARLAFLSALCGAFSSLFIYLASLRLTGKVLIAFISALTASFSLNMWNLSNTAEVYSLNILFFSIISYLLVVFSEEGEERTLFLIVFLIGLGMSNHLTLGAIIPSFVIVLFSLRKRVFRHPMRVIALMAIIFMAGLSLYLYIPVRAAQDPLLNWGDPRTLSGCIGHLSFSSYGDYFFARSAHQVLTMMRGVADFYLDGFGVPVAILAIAGFALMLKRRVLLSSAFFLPVLFLTVFVVNFGSGGKMAEEQQSFYLPSTVFTALFLAEACAAVVRYFERNQMNRFLIVGITVAFSLIPIHLAAVNYRKVDKSWDRSAVVFAKSIYDSMDKPAMLLTDHTTLAFVFSYIQVVEEKWRDVVPVYLPLLQHEWYRKKLISVYPELILNPKNEFRNVAAIVKDNREVYNIYTRQAFNRKIIPSRFLIPHGPVMKVSLDTVQLDREKIESHRSLLKPYEKESSYLRNPLYKANLSLTYISVATIFAEAGLYDDALTEARKAFLLDPEATGPYLIAAGILERKGEFEEALALCKKALQYEPNDHGVMVKMGVLYEKLQQTEDAFTMYERALKKNPDSAVAHARLGLLQYRNGSNPAMAEHHLREAVKRGYTSAGIDSVMEELEKTVNVR